MVPLETLQRLLSASQPGASVRSVCLSALSHLYYVERTDARDTGKEKGSCIGKIKARIFAARGVDSLVILVPEPDHGLRMGRGSL